MIYQKIRPLLFRLQAEQAHELVHRAGKMSQYFPLGWLRHFLSFTDSRLHQECWGLHFDSPVGLAAGMDKNAELLDFWQMLGMGFVEVGSVTALASDGNPPPRMFRLERDEALINRMGLNNRGAEWVAKHLQWRRSSLRIPLGINLAKTHNPDIMGDDAIDDFVGSYRLLSPFAGYIVLNVSCPNTTEGKTFEDPAALDELLSAILEVRSPSQKHPPLLAKLSPPPTNDWKADRTFNEMLAVLQKHQLDGLVLSNTGSNRDILATSANELEQMGRGGLSGRPLTLCARHLMRMVYQRTNGQIPLIGVGGIRSAKDAYAMIRAGASLVQVYTGLIYEGPGLIRKIQEGLLEFLCDDGFDTIKDAVGVDA